MLAHQTTSTAGAKYGKLPFYKRLHAYTSKCRTDMSKQSSKGIVYGRRITTEVHCSTCCCTRYHKRS